MNNIMISEAAFKHINTLALSTGYAWADGPSRRLARMIRAWDATSVQWTDARPPYVRDEDENLRASKVALQWWDGSTTTRYALGTLPMPYLASIATHFHIRPLSHQRPTIEGLSLTRPRAYLRPTAYSLASAVLQAIGQQWLTPRQPLPHMAPTRDRRTSTRDRLAFIS